MNFFVADIITASPGGERRADVSGGGWWNVGGTWNGEGWVGAGVKAARRMKAAAFFAAPVVGRLRRERDQSSAAISLNP